MPIGPNEQEFQRLRRAGVTLPTNPIAARQASSRMTSMARDSGSFSDNAFVHPRLSMGRESLNAYASRRYGSSDPTASSESARQEQNMHIQRSMMRTANAPPGYSGSAVMAWPKERDPFQYWQDKIWWFGRDKDPDVELKKIRDWCNTPEAPVWMGDYSFKPIGEINVGDEVIGW